MTSKTIQLDPNKIGTAPPEVLLSEDISLQNFVLDLVHNTKTLKDVDIISLITAGEVVQTIEGASNLNITLRDPKQELLKSGTFSRAVDVRIDNLWFRLVGINKNDAELELVFEDRDVIYIRKHNEVKSASRKTFTRAEFCVWLVKQVKNRKFYFVCPELHTTQTIKRTTQQKRTEKADRVRSSGIDSKADLTVKDVKADASQIVLMGRVLDECSRNNAGPKATKACVEACIVESVFHNSSKVTDGTSQGILQAQVGIAGKSKKDGGGVFSAADAVDVEMCVRAFLLDPGFSGSGGAISLAKKNPGKAAGDIAAMVQAPRSDLRSKYNLWDEEADKIIEAYGGTPENPDIVLKQYRKQYKFSTQDGDKAENWWDAIGRLMEEVGWRRFMSNGVLYLISEADLFKSKSRMKLTHDTPGVTMINFNYDVGHEIDSAEITCRASRWIAPPGSIVQLEDCGPADGNWLVSTFRRDLFTRDATISLKKPNKELPEPASELGTVADLPEKGPRRTGKAGEIKGVILDRRYGGSQSIMEQFVIPFMKENGFASGSKKRTPAENAAVGGADQSDHLTTQTKSYATDFPTGAGLEIAGKLAREFGWKTWKANSYNNFQFNIGDRKFNLQILWGAAIEHGDHVHVGIRRI